MFVNKYQGGNVVIGMNLNLDLKTSIGYKSNSQKARVLTEGWVLKEIYCPSCGLPINEYINNKPVADFYCLKCSEDFELKAKKGKFGRKVSAGAYSQMIKRINSKEKPNFFFMGYEVIHSTISDLFVVPKHFFVNDIIEKRKPLSDTAKRAGWVGSNILFSRIPKAGQIFYIEHGNKVHKNDVLAKWRKTVFLKEIKKPEAKGWILDIMNCIDDLGKKEFSLKEIYKYELELAKIHLENKNIRPKIRQQLQLLRDKNYLKFLGNGLYSVK